MEILKFTLSGRTAFFKIPEVNSYVYFSYGHIHKVSLLGLLGAVMGYGGYNSQGEKEYPEFYEKLKDIKISIMPKNTNGSFSKKIQFFNNSVGYASNEEGGNLIVKEQWLEDVEWDIFIKIEDTDIHKELKERMKNYNFEYTVYLGKNDHLATINNVEIFQGENFLEDESEINSLFMKEHIEGFSEEEFNVLGSENDEIKYDHKYEEKLPLSLQNISNQYEVESLIFTNKKCILKNKNNFVKVNNQIIEFY
ncbi:type I-B CRISPR-associated protein Cas5b [Fusobacterium sp.]|uniref:type I-B CRISPR-associated protein Cas5b n=1 Tax=Fusobacterium sp. TaxID=68766 RepID=UPI002903F263|nr:type I-B CRISPR-associated protein Cas5b [Fusobacterium sp.]MDU1911349.1 type I-B CRISPR-associated protein Cas5b [Fusobacterium sp.]